MMTNRLGWFPTILKSIADAVIVGDAGGCVTFMNPAAETLTGWTLDQAEGKPVAEILPLFEERTGRPFGPPPASEFLKPGPIELPQRPLLRTRFGTLVPVEQTTSPIEADGIIAGTAVVFRDLSAQRCHDESLGQRNERRRIVSETTGKRLANDPPEALFTRLFDSVSDSLGVEAAFHFKANSDADALQLDTCRAVPETIALSCRQRDFEEAIRDSVGLLPAPIAATELENPDNVDVQLVESVGIGAYARNPRMAGDCFLRTLSSAIRNRDRLGEDELDLLETVCQCVSLARERQRLLTEERERADRLQRSAEALSRSEHELRFALEVGNLGSWHIAFPSKELRCSARCKADFGRGPDDSFSFDDFLASIHSDDYEFVNSRIERAFRTGEDYEAEYRACWPDGSVHWIFARGRPIDDASTSGLGFVGLTLDVTERRRDEALLEQQKHILELVVLDSSLAEVLDALCQMIERESDEAMHASILLLDPDGLHLRHGAAPTLPEAYCQAIDGVAIGPVAGSCGTSAYRKTPVYASDIASDPLWVDYADLALAHGLRACWSQPILSSNGAVLGTFAMYYRHPRLPGSNDLRLIDIVTRTATIAIERKRFEHELQQRNAQLVEADRRKNEFLAMLAHELRNPLSSIGNTIQLLREDRTGEYRSWANEILDRQVRHLARLIDDLLDASRLTHGKIELQRESIDVLSVLNQAVEAVGPAIARRQQRLILCSPAGSLPAVADPLRLEQILVNLLTNSVKYTPTGGQIKVTAARASETITLSVKDDGIGISPERIPQMFELFTQGDRTLARSEGGLGIGLTIVRTLVEMHGGTITANSDGPGKGSEFIVTLPATSHAVRPLPLPVPAQPPEAAQPANRQAQARRLLVVDDNEDAAKSMTRLLRLLGHTVATAATGTEAVELVNDFKPDIVLLDIGLPGMDGYQVARKLREDQAHEHLTIIAVSGYGQEEDRRRSATAGFNHHLVKPVNYDALLTLLARPCPAAEVGR